MEDKDVVCNEEEKHILAFYRKLNKEHKLIFLEFMNSLEKLIDDHNVNEAKITM